MQRNACLYEINFAFVDESKCLSHIKLPSLQTCASYSELPSNIRIMAQPTLMADRETVFISGLSILSLLFALYAYFRGSRYNLTSRISMYPCLPMAQQPLMRMRPWLCVLYVSTYITLNLSTAKYNPFFSPTSIEDQTQQDNQNLDIEE